MENAEYIDRIVVSLKKVPAKQLLIIELVNRFTRNGELDYDGLAEVQDEVNIAIDEAKAYGAQTMRAVDSLSRLEAISVDVGS